MNNPGARDFFLGILVAVALLLIWKKESRGWMAGAGAGSSAGSGSLIPTGSCAGCQASGAAAPAAQGGYSQGSVSPGTPPLNGTGSSSGAYAQAGITSGNATRFNPNGTSTYNPPGSPTTPSTVTPIRATDAVKQYMDTGFVAHYRSLSTRLPN